jgi:hypothetical protein
MSAGSGETSVSSSTRHTSVMSTMPGQPGLADDRQAPGMAARHDPGRVPDARRGVDMAARVASSGAFASPTCTRLMTVQETLAALGGAGATVYRAPGQPE